MGGAINVRPKIGLGGFGFMTGVWVGVTFTGDVVKQASEAMVDCHGASGSATIDSGVGYQLRAYQAGPAWPKPETRSAWAIRNGGLVREIRQRIEINLSCAAIRMLRDCFNL